MKANSKSKQSKYKSINYDYSGLYPTVIVNFKGLKKEMLREERIKKLKKLNNE